MVQSLAGRTRAAVLALIACTASATSPVAGTTQGDLRDLTIGAAVADLPNAGYAGFRCADAPDVSLAGWQDWRKCPRDPSGLHGIRFGYDPATAPEGTKVGGHLVVLELLISDDAHVDGLRIATDPASRLYMRKKAFLLGLQAKSRYGEDGWVCTEGSPSADKQPVGGVFVREQCKKSIDGRQVSIERNLFARPGRDLKDFVGESRITILRAP